MEPAIDCVKILNDCQRNAHGSHLLFQNEAKNIPGQAFVIKNISCKLEKTNFQSFRDRLRENLYTHYSGVAMYKPMYPLDVSIRYT